MSDGSRRIDGFARPWAHLAHVVVNRVLSDSAPFRRTLALIVVLGLVIVGGCVVFAALAPGPILCGLGGGLVGAGATRCRRRPPGPCPCGAHSRELPSMDSAASNDPSGAQAGRAAH
jgi:hypothetical protein